MGNNSGRQRKKKRKADAGEEPSTKWKKRVGKGRRGKDKPLATAAKKKRTCREIKRALEKQQRKKWSLGQAHPNNPVKIAETRAAGKQKKKKKKKKKKTEKT